MSEISVTAREVADCGGDTEALNALLEPFIPKGGNLGGFRVAVKRFVSSLNFVDASRKGELWDQPIAVGSAQKAERTSTPARSKSGKRR